MANDVGYIRPEDVPALKLWLDIRGVGWNPGHGQWEVIRIAYGGHNCVVTRNQKEQYKTPVELRPLLLEFRDYMLTLASINAEPETEEEITDTTRLNFMLNKQRKVSVEVAGWGNGTRYYEVYVEEGFMSDKKYPSVRITSNTEENFQGVYGMEIKREAIDLAINEVRSKSSD